MKSNYSRDPIVQKEKRRLTRLRYYRRNRARLVAEAIERTRKARKKDPERYRQYARKGYVIHREANNARALRWKKQNKKRAAEIQKRWQKKAVLNLSASYVRMTLRPTPGLKIPETMIQAQRMILSLSRIIKKQKGTK